MVLGAQDTDEEARREPQYLGQWPCGREQQQGLPGPRITTEPLLVPAPLARRICRPPKTLLGKHKSVGWELNFQKLLR